MAKLRSNGSPPPWALGSPGAGGASGWALSGGGAIGASHALVSLPVAIVAGCWWWAIGLPSGSPPNPGEDFRRLSDARDIG